MSHLRLSQSGLWERQRQYYDEKGVAAWNTGTVPHYITNNPVIGCAYADQIVAFLEDFAREGRLDTEKPVYLVEMGGGSGRLAYYILRRLQMVGELLPARICYVLTDFTESNLAHWREHPNFAPFFADGTLDLACFEVENDSALQLESGARLPSEENDNPVIFLANYLFDTLTQDSFRIEGGLLQEAIPEIVYQEDTTLFSYTYLEADESPYARADYDTILRDYTSTLGDTSFLFPVGPLKCLENLCAISKSRACLITADKAWARWEDLLGLNEPLITSHGPSFSMTVNFHAMGLWWEGLGGRVYHTQARDSLLQIACFCLGLPQEGLQRTRRVFEDRMDHFGPLDFFNLKSAIIQSAERKSLRLCLELLRLSRWDPEILFGMAEELLGLLDTPPTLHKRELFVALSRTWQNYFPIGESKDFPFEIARILFRLEFYEQSLHFYQKSLELFGDHKMTYHNMGLCYYNLRRLKQSKRMFEKALELDAGYGVSREWLVRIAPEIEESGNFAGLT